METDVELVHRTSRRKIVIDTKFTSLLKASAVSGIRSAAGTSTRSMHTSGPRLTKTSFLYRRRAYYSTRRSIARSMKPPASKAIVVRFTTVDLAGEASSFRGDLMRIVDQTPAWPRPALMLYRRYDFRLPQMSLPDDVWALERGASTPSMACSVVGVRRSYLRIPAQRASTSTPSNRR